MLQAIRILTEIRYSLSILMEQRAYIGAAIHENPIHIQHILGNITHLM